MTPQSPNSASTPVPAPKKSSLRALKSKNYRLYFAGQGTSLIGTWLTTTAMAWLVNDLSHQSAIMLGIVGFASQIPAFVLAPFAGVWIDHTNRHRLLIVTQILSMLESFALAVLALAGVIRVWHVIALCIFQGLVNAFDMPTRQSFLVEMIDSGEDLSNAIALNSSMVNGAQLLGPALAGLLIAAVGTGYCFLLDGVTYLAVIASLLLMRLRPRAAVTDRPNMLHAMREGFSYAFGVGPIRTILLLFAVVALAGSPYRVLMPIFAVKIFHGGPITFGFLTAATGIGALLGAIYLARRGSVLGLGRVLVMSTMLCGTGLVAFAGSKFLWLALITLLMAGMGRMVHMAAANTILQTIVDDDKRGRVMSYYTMAFMGAMPFGSLITGALAQRLGAPWAVAIGGSVCLLAAGLFYLKLPRLRTMIRPIYIRKGILPELATAVSTATELETRPGDS